MVKLFQFENKGDSKGPVINLDFSGMSVVEIPVFYRESDSNPEGHFHKGTDPSYDPQYIYVLQGVLEFLFISPEGKRETVVVNKLHGVVVPKMVYHKYKTVGYTIFCEPRLEKFDINNSDEITCSPEEYTNIISEIFNNE